MEAITRALSPRNHLFVSPLCDSARTVEVWKFTIVDPIEHPLDAPDCLKHIKERRRWTRLRCFESRPYDRLIEPLPNVV